MYWMVDNRNWLLLLIYLAAEVQKCPTVVYHCWQYFNGVYYWLKYEYKLVNISKIGKSPINQSCCQHFTKVCTNVSKNAYWHWIHSYWSRYKNWPISAFSAQKVQCLVFLLYFLVNVKAMFNRKKKSPLDICVCVHCK